MTEHLTDDGLAPDTPVRFRAKRSMGELVNSVTGTSLDPEQMWAMTDCASRVVVMQMEGQEPCQQRILSFAVVRYMPVMAVL